MPSPLDVSLVPLRSARRLALAALLAGCAAMRGTPDKAPAPAAGGGIALVTGGSALVSGAHRERLAHAVGRATGRRVVTLDAAAVDHDGEAFAVGLLATHPGARRYDWHEPRCAGGRELRVALAHGVDAIYRATLDYERHTRPAGAGDPQPSVLVRTLAAVGLADRGAMSDESLIGTVVITAFGKDSRPQIVSVNRREQHDVGMFAGHLDVDDALDDVARGLPAVAAMDPAAMARRLLARGCPLLALAVYETRLRPAGGNADVRTQALAAIEGRQAAAGAQRSAREVRGRFEAAVRAENFEQASTLLAQYEAAPGHDARRLERMRAALADKAPAATSLGTGERYSCDALCTVHMIELCNADRALWNAHRVRFETTPCGTRRPEDFLRECYRRQWLSGTFRDACVRPCEASPDGRDRLRSILRAGGCARLGAS